jgi:hypothetical protein
MELAAVTGSVDRSGFCAWDQLPTAMEIFGMAVRAGRSNGVKVAVGRVRLTD